MRSKARRTDYIRSVIPGSTDIGFMSTLEQTEAARNFSHDRIVKVAGPLAHSERSPQLKG
ncbi:MAG: hypothetical protein CV089_21325 [Nitrospira sp. WS110]|nr:hypothetical protein [Nitrospira sp. WS110]